MSGRVSVIHADCREAIKALADCSVDASVTDPPYALVSIAKRFGNSKAENEKFASSNPVSAYRSSRMHEVACNHNEFAMLLVFDGEPGEYGYAKAPPLTKWRAWLHRALHNAGRTKRQPSIRHPDSYFGRGAP